MVDKEACYAICSYMTEGSACYDLKIVNNIAAGCEFGGFVAPGYDCDIVDDYTFRGNVAHSGSGAGAYIYPAKASSKQGTCYQGSHFAAYKNQLQCVETHYNTREQRFHDLSLIHI